MKKIPTIFIRNPENMRELLNEHHPDCGWVFAGEGVATKKYDGTCCKIEDSKLWKRREVKPGKKIPDLFVEEQLDDNTGKRVGWMPVDCKDKQDKWHCEAFNNQPDGTYELCGPKVQGNHEKYKEHALVSHRTAEEYPHFPRIKSEMKLWLMGRDIEGIVFHHSDGRMAKIKLRDFNIKR